MKRILVIDDERVFPSLEGDGTEVFYARSSAAAIAYLSNADLLSFDEAWFDHDLGPDDDAMKVVRFMEQVQAALGHGLIWPSRIGRARVHSMNPVGGNRLRAAVSALGVPTRRVTLPEGHDVVRHHEGDD